MEIIISDRVSAYGIYIRGLLDRKKVVYIKAHDIERFKKYPTSSLLIFVVSEESHIPFLRRTLENHFDKAIICYDILYIPNLPISKPHITVSLNKLRTVWMNDILLALVKLKGKEAEALFNKSSSIVMNYLSTPLNEKQDEW